MKIKYIPAEELSDDRVVRLSIDYQSDGYTAHICLNGESIGYFTTGPDGLGVLRVNEQKLYHKFNIVVGEVRD